ncbi:tetratricopeptide repeat protein [Nostoc spongiaeforme FACHB-130]|uniref:Tetratricopeptide repeat protein n=1 Tax=Nostoc spongiaeforme FACHB-130 TaxID=1357510 RepID=A0ABR8FYD5_9NOSO|nr:tetratricopeptide repeat protein [Nostoc spongiaeforme]MBD2596452.1 tetratricopeptide repeat protein [Nostoc spongiaeforme FACHB-130]
MSINFRKRSLTDGNRALQLFTDRHELTRVFAAYINEEPAAETILSFYGDGGNGKSLLLKFLRTKCCKRFGTDTWQKLKTKTAAEVAEDIEFAHSWEFEQVPAILQDFGLAPNGDDQPQDPFYGLLMLRRSLARAATELNYRLRFPLYDFACVWYLKQKNRLTPEKLQEWFPSEEVDLLIEIGNAISGTSWGTIGKAVFGIFDKHLGENFQLYLQRRGLKEAEVQEIRGMDAETELINELPRYLAQDLNVAMLQKKAPPRIVLFFDTHEAFWGSQRQQTGILYFQRDEWLRYFLAELELQAGIVAVIAGREAPHWEEADNFSIPQQYIDTQLVSHLSPTDADVYLRRAEIRDEELRQSAIAYSSVRENQVHPLLLGLSADVILQAQAQRVTLSAADFPKTAETVDKAQILINRLLKYADREISYAVHALSACRSFNFEIYRLLGAELHFTSSKPAFDILTEFSFVWDVEQLGEDWYRIHDLLRRLNYETNNAITQQAHDVLEKYYRQQGQVAEAIYHANRLDWRRGVYEWVEVFEEALRLSRYQQCRSLLEVRSELIINSDFQLGRVSQFEGDYYAQLARYSAAQTEYLEAVAAYNRELTITPNDTSTLNNKGIVLCSLGDLQTQLAQHPQALQSYTDAIATCDQALKLAPDDISALNSKGSALGSLGDLQIQLAQYPQALQSYTDAIAAYDQALNLAPDYIQIRNNKGAALQNVGDLQTQLAQYPQAIQSYTDAITACDQVLKLAPDDNYALNNKGLALERLGDLQTQLAQYPQAIQSYTDAISVYDQALKLAPDYISALSNKGVALNSLGDLQTQLAQYSQAIQSYTDAIAAYEQALKLAPDDINALNNKGVAFQKLGNLQTQLAQYSQAIQSYTDAIVAYDQALKLAPDYISALNNKGVALHSLGNLQAQLAQHSQALQSYTDAIATYDQILKLAPDDNYALNNKGLALQSLGNLQTQIAQYPQALQSYTDAIATYDKALKLAPDYISALTHKGVALNSLGELQTQLAQYPQAIQSYTDAIAAYDKALKLASDYIPALNNKGVALQNLGDLQTQLSQHPQAIQSYTDAIAAYDQVLKLAPEDIYTLNNKGNTFQKWGKLLLQLSQQPEAINHLQAALAAFNRSLAIAPGDEDVRNQRDEVQELLDNL